MIHTQKKLVCGLLGETLGHSFSPQIHARLADYDYRLFEVGRQELGDFLLRGAFDALNVTIPYKQAVMPYLAGVSDRARRIGAVNTVLRRGDGSLWGDNTDYDGFLFLLREAGLDGAVAGSKVLVAGSGGASRTVQTVLQDLGAGSVTVLSRSGEDNYTNLSRHKDTRLIINTTPVGMYPHNGEAPLSLDGFLSLAGVADLIYNPARTALLLDARARGIPAANGLSMLVAQAKRAAELFTGQPIPDGEVRRVTLEIARDTSNLVLVGMPGCGKSTVGALLAKRLCRPFLDTDRMVAERTGTEPGELIRTRGEAYFREIEHECVAEAGRATGAVIATGGGVVTRQENYEPLCQNGRIVFLDRPVSTLPTEGRPLSAGDLGELYRRRLPLYERFSDLRVPVGQTAEQTADNLLEVWSK